MIRCIAAAFRTEMPQEEVEYALTGAFITIAMMNDTDETDEKIAGFVTLKKSTYAKSPLPDIFPWALKEDETVYSLAAGVVDKSFQGHGIYKKLNEKRIGEIIRASASLFHTKTQNPAVERGIVSTLERF